MNILIKKTIQCRLTRKEHIMGKFKDFISHPSNKELAYRWARENTCYDTHHQASLPPDGEIANDIFWDRYFKEMGN